MDRDNQRNAGQRQEGGASHAKDVPHQQHKAGATQPQPGRAGGGHDSGDVGKDTDNDGRVVKPGHKAGDVDGPRSRSVGKDTDDDGRVVKPGHKPGDVDGPKAR